MLHLLCDIIDLKDFILKTFVTEVLAIFLEFAKIIFNDSNIPKSALLRCTEHLFAHKLVPERNLLIDVGQKKFVIFHLKLFGCALYDVSKVFCLIRYGTIVVIHLLVDMRNFTLDLLVLSVSAINSLLLLYTSFALFCHLFLFAAIIVE